MTKSEGQNSEIVPDVVAPDEAKSKLSVVEVSAHTVQEQHTLAQFKGRPMLLLRQPYPHYTALHSDRFARLAYPLLGGVTRGRIKDVEAFVGAMAPDLTTNSNLILFGTEDPIEEYYHQRAVTAVWDTDTLEYKAVTPELAEACVWRSPYGQIASPDAHGPVQRIPFIMSLAGNDCGLYDDIMQSIAPMVMTKKPDGVIWWVGDGANGKSTLMDALYHIFPGQLASLTVGTLTAKVDTPFLNGNLANIVKESSEGRIEDTEIYKAIGTHENFRTHKFHSQETYEINGNMHHVFSANSIPTFNDKGFSARRRTFIIPFLQRFESDPLFEDRTFTPEMFGRLITEMCRYAQAIAARGYRYKWSAATLAAKLDYDSSANNAEEYAKYLISIGVVGFDSFHPVKMHYENWCADEGYLPLGVTNLRRAINALGFERTSRPGAATGSKMYRLSEIKAKGDLIPLGMGQPGMYTITGFRPEDVEAPEPVVPDFKEPTPPEPEEPPAEEAPPPEPPAPPELPPEPAKKSILNNKW
jgi:hypothetical protein